MGANNFSTCSSILRHAASIGDVAYDVMNVSYTYRGIFRAQGLVIPPSRLISNDCHHYTDKYGGVACKWWFYSAGGKKVRLSFDDGQGQICSSYITRLAKCLRKACKYCCKGVRRVLKRSGPKPTQVLVLIGTWSHQQV